MPHMSIVNSYNSILFQDVIQLTSTSLGEKKTYRQRKAVPRRVPTLPRPKEYVSAS